MAGDVQDGEGTGSMTSAFQMSGPFGSWRERKEIIKQSIAYRLRKGSSK